MTSKGNLFMTDFTNVSHISTFKDLQKHVGEWSKYNFPNNEPYQPLLGIGEELGELYHSFLKLSQGIRGSNSEHHEWIKDAVGDLLIYTADFCERFGVDLEECVCLAWKDIKDRDWVKYPQTGKPVIDADHGYTIPDPPCNTEQRIFKMEEIGSINQYIDNFKSKNNVEIKSVSADGHYNGTYFITVTIKYMKKNEVN